MTASCKRFFNLQQVNPVAVILFLVHNTQETLPKIHTSFIPTNDELANDEGPGRGGCDCELGTVRFEVRLPGISTPSQVAR